MNKFALIFPGQGSQKIGMLAELAAYYPLVKTTFAEASSVLGYELWKLVKEGPIEILNKTEYTQPALLAASVAIWRIWQQQNGPKPILMAGHSLGEYSALVCAGVLDFATAIKLVSFRGALMQSVVSYNGGAMAAIIGLDNEVIVRICQKVSQGQIVSLANLNAPGQVVIAGHKEALERAIIYSKVVGAKYAKFLPVSVPAHCILMKPAAQSFSKILKLTKFSVPLVGVVNNVDVSVEYHPMAIRNALVRQLYNPVRWNEIINYIISQRITMFFEIGPGNILTKINKRIHSIVSSYSINDFSSMLSAINMNK